MCARGYAGVDLDADLAVGIKMKMFFRVRARDRQGRRNRSKPEPWDNSCSAVRDDCILREILRRHEARPASAGGLDVRVSCRRLLADLRSRPYMVNQRAVAGLDK